MPVFGRDAGMLMNLGEVSFMLRPFRARRGLRPWIAVAPSSYDLRLEDLIQTSRLDSEHFRPVP
jgi:hypothetical protein